MIFTTIQKISPAASEIAYPVRSNRRNIVVIADGHIGTSMVSKQAEYRRKSPMVLPSIFATASPTRLLSALREHRSKRTM